MISCLACLLLSLQVADEDISISYINRQMNLMSQDQRIYLALRMAQVAYVTPGFDKWSANWIDGYGRSKESANRMHAIVIKDWEKHGRGDQSPCSVAFLAISVVYLRAEWLATDPITKKQKELFDDSIWRDITRIASWLKDNNVKISMNEIMDLCNEAREWKDLYKHRLNP